MESKFEVRSEVSCSPANSSVISDMNHEFVKYNFENVRKRNVNNHTASYSPINSSVINDTNHDYDKYNFDNVTKHKVNNNAAESMSSIQNFDHMLKDQLNHVRATHHQKYLDDNFHVYHTEDIGSPPKPPKLSVKKT